MSPQLLLQLLVLMSVAALSRGQHCTGSDGQLVFKGFMVPDPEDGCKSLVCRCASEDRCEFVSELRTVMIRVNETTRHSETGEVAQTNTLLMRCSCTDHLPESTEMDFTCQSPNQPGRDVGAKVIGCLDTAKNLRLPGEKVSISNTRKELLQCDCSSDGHYVNCLPEDDLGDSCLDADSGARVPLATTYYRLERNSRGLPIRLRCMCVRSDQETSCTLA